MTKTTTENAKHSGTGAERSASRKNIGLWTLFHKEMSDHIRSRRFLLILALVVITGFSSLYGALENISSVAADGGDFIFLKLFTTSGSAIPSFASFIALLGPFVGLALGFDAINSEQNSGTLNRLLSQPIYRDSVINGKFLAGSAIIFIMIFVMGGMVSAIGLLAIGIPPSPEEVGRILVFLFFTSVYICGWPCPSCFPCCAATRPPAPCRSSPAGCFLPFFSACWQASSRRPCIPWTATWRCST